MGYSATDNRQDSNPNPRDCWRIRPLGYSTNQASVHCSKQCYQIISATSRKKFLRMPRIKPGAAGWEARMLPLCYAAPRGFFTRNKPKRRLFQWCSFWSMPGHSRARFRKLRHPTNLQERLPFDSWPHQDLFILLASREGKKQHQTRPLFNDRITSSDCNLCSNSEGKLALLLFASKRVTEF